MPRYIDVSEYIEYLSELMESAKKHNKFNDAAGLQREINRCSSFFAADVAPVVRCKDCAYYSKSTLRCFRPVDDISVFTENAPNIWYENDYCSYGKLKEAQK